MTGSKEELTKQNDAGDGLCSCTVGNSSCTLVQAEQSHHASHENNTFVAVVSVASEDRPLMQ